MLPSGAGASAVGAAGVERGQRAAGELATVDAKCASHLRGREDGAVLQPVVVQFITHTLAGTRNGTTGG